MPNIVEYNAPTHDIPQPTDIAASAAREAGMVENRFGREAGEAIGSTISRIGGQIGDAIDNHIASQAIGHGAAVYSSMFSDLTSQWNQLAAKADPNDTSIADGFKEKVLEPALQKFTQAFDGYPARAQQWAMTQADSLRQHFTTTVSADMGTRAAAAVHQNLSDMTINLSNTLQNDPTALGHAVDTIKGSVGALVSASPFLGPGEAARVKTELVPELVGRLAQSAFRGAAMANPDAALADLAKGSYDGYLALGQKDSLEREGQEIKRQKMVTDEHNLAMQEQQQRMVDKGAQTEYIDKILNGQHIDPRAIAADNRMSAATKENIVNFVAERTRQTRENTDTQPHPVEVRQLLTGMATNPDNFNPNSINDAFVKGDLNPKEYAQLQARYGTMDKPFERNFNTQMLHVANGLRSNIAFSADISGTQAASAINMMESDARNTIDDYRRQGKDVQPLLDPRSSQYLFTPAKVQSYLPSRTAAAAPMKQGAPDQALQYLKAHPEMSAAFKAKYGYLPGENK